jgi:HSP20 family protein
MFTITPMRKAPIAGREMVRPSFPLARLNNEFETIFNRFFAGLPVPFEGWTYPETKWAFDVEELAEEFVIHAEAPGFEVNDFEILVNGNVLTLKAEHKVVNGEKKGPNYRCERCLEETVTLPVGIKAEKIEAFYKNGILEVHVPKLEETKPRRVIVKT